MPRFDELPAGEGLKKGDWTNPTANILNEALKDDGAGGGALGVIIVGGGGGGSTPTNGALSSTYTVATGPGVTPADVAHVSIQNVGVENGSIDTGAGPEIIYPGQSIPFDAYLHPVTNEFRLVQPITYNGTGTILTIRVSV